MGVKAEKHGLLTFVDGWLDKSTVKFSHEEPADLNEPYWLEGRDMHLLQFSVWLCRTTINKTKSANKLHTSYGMKHGVERLTDGGGYSYMTNGQFKFVMAMAGFRAFDMHCINWRYNVAENSPFFKFEEDSFKPVFDKMVREPKRCEMEAAAKLVDDDDEKLPRIRSLGEIVDEWNALTDEERIARVYSAADEQDRRIDYITDRYLEEMPSYSSREAGWIDGLMHSHREIAEMMRDAIRGDR